MKPNPPSLKDLPSQFVNKCIGWNVGAWQTALQSGLDLLTENNINLVDKRVLELGGGTHSTLAPIFEKLGAMATSSFYNDRGMETLLFEINDRYKTSVDSKQIDIFGDYLDDKYDIVICKSVLGGIARGNEKFLLARALKSIQKNLLTEDGVIFTLDNLYGSTLAQFLRSRLGAGRNRWNYFTLEELRSAVPENFELLSRTNGVLSFASTSNRTANALVNYADSLFFDWAFPSAHSIGASIIIAIPDSTFLNGDEK